MRHTTKHIEIKELNLDLFIGELFHDKITDSNNYKELLMNLFKISGFKKPYEKYWLMEYNKMIVGLFIITIKKNNQSAIIKFLILKGDNIPEDDLKMLLRKGVKNAFELYNLNRIQFNYNKSFPLSISKLFINEFNPYPIGFIHLNDEKYVLTRNRFNGIKEQFYKSDYLNYLGRYE
ncbi:hypothetical protein ACFSKN_09680 [Mariniflexile gromovii]|uniref:GNAT family N-acetyltransferase n=1 Tax=Mariniflexile gromovii TaxID=362523 RepID=A0ABS4BWT9_9FLAO|nr:hypothetical protein [Mariniflexile gromovii]MBP0905060.1 hypothetical protein [Mariniflexile gromovii]